MPSKLSKSSSSSSSAAKATATDQNPNGSGDSGGVRYEIPSDHADKGFVIIRQPERQFNVSKDNKLAQRDLKKEGIGYSDWAMKGSGEK